MKRPSLSNAVRSNREIPAAARMLLGVLVLGTLGGCSSGGGNSGGVIDTTSPTAQFQRSSTPRQPTRSAWSVARVALIWSP